MSFNLGASSRTAGVGDPEITELQRRVANLVRHGKVSAVRFTAVRPEVRVTIGNPARLGEHLTTAWLPWPAARAAAGVRSFSPPEVGEAVTLVSPGGDLRNAVVQPGGLNTTATPAPGDRAGLHRTVYGDGTVVEFDVAAGAMAISSPGKLDLTLTGPVTVRAEVVQVQDCNVEVTGGNVVVTGGDVTADGVSLQNHIHTAVTPGPLSSVSGPPKVA